MQKSKSFVLGICLAAMLLIIQPSTIRAQDDTAPILPASATGVTSDTTSDHANAASLAAESEMAAHNILPAGFGSNVTALALGWYHSCALLASGEVQCWGQNDHGQLGRGFASPYQVVPSKAVNLTGVVAIDANQHHTCAVTLSGTVKCWGFNINGALGGGVPDAPNPAPVEASGFPEEIRAVTVGQDHTCALSRSGTVYCWGGNGFGQLGLGDNEKRMTPTAVPGLGTGVKSVSAGLGATCAIVASGQAYCWGQGYSGKLGIGNEDNQNTPQAIAIQATEISTFVFHACAVLTTGATQCWGANNSGQIGNGTVSVNALTPATVATLGSNVRSVSVGASHSCAVTKDGAAHCWGSGVQTGGDYQSSQLTPVQVLGLQSGVQQLEAGFLHTCAVTNLDEVLCWGNNSMGQVSLYDTEEVGIPIRISVALRGIKAVALGSGYLFNPHACVLTLKGTVLCWGSNAVGQLGDGTTEDRFTPVQVAGLPGGVRSISLDRDRGCAVTLADGLRCWGSMTSEVNSPIPVEIGGLESDVQDVDVGATYHSCALTTGGGVKCWGNNSEGELGNGTTDRSDVPIDVSGLGSGVQQVNAGYGISCALMAGGSVKCWGGGFVDYWSISYPAVPTDVPGLSSGVRSISLNEANICALTGDSVKCWGNNSFGGVGDGTQIDREEPVNVSGLNGRIRSVAANWERACAITADAGLKCWGRNQEGQLGDGTTANRLVPVDVIGLESGVQQVTVDAWRTCAVTTTNEVKCWGSGIANRTEGDGIADLAWPDGEIACSHFESRALAGTVSLVSGTVLSGVSMALAGGSARTDIHGGFALGGLCPGTYTVTPTLAGYTFSPQYRVVDLTSGTVQNADFTATPIPPLIKNYLPFVSK